jgi:hypothetical protein
MTTISEALISLGEALGAKGYDIFDLGCDDDEDLIIYALLYLENHLDDVFEDRLNEKSICGHGNPRESHCPDCFPL